MVKKCECTTMKLPYYNAAIRPGSRAGDSHFVNTGHSILQICFHSFSGETHASGSCYGRCA